MNPEVTAHLQTLAEIAIALAGFTGLVGAIQARGGKGLAGPEMAVICTLIAVSGLVLFAAFVPGTVSLLTDNEEDIWKWSFRSLLFAHVLAWVVSAPFVLRLGPTLGLLAEPQRSVGRVATSLGLSAVVVEAAVVVGYLVEHLAFIYQSLLLVLVSIAFTAFVMLLFGLER